MAQLKTTRDFGVIGEQPIVVGYILNKAFNGRGMSPDEPESVTIYTVTLGRNEIIDQLSRDEITALRQECLEDHHESAEVAAERKGDEMRDRRRAATC